MPGGGVTAGRGGPCSAPPCCAPTGTPWNATTASRTRNPPEISLVHAFIGIFLQADLKVGLYVLCDVEADLQVRLRSILGGMIWRHRHSGLPLVVVLAALFTAVMAAQAPLPLAGQRGQGPAPGRQGQAPAPLPASPV